MERPGVGRTLRLVLLGDGAWAARSLAALAAGPHGVAGVVLRRHPSDDLLRAEARDAGVPVLQPAAVNDAATHATLRALEADLALSVAYDQILRRDTLALWPMGCLNFHAGMLPRYRGRNVLNWALVNGEREIGVTAHVVDEGIDTGDVVMQRTVPVGWTDTYGDVLARVVALMPSLVTACVDAAAAGRLERRPQDGARATYVGRRRAGDEWIDWREPSEVLHNLVRGISRPGPGARTCLAGREVTVWRALFDPAWPRYRATPGEVVGAAPDGGRWVKTGDATLLVLEAQEADGPPGPPRWPVGTRLDVSPAEGEVRQLRARVAALEAELGALREAHALR